MRAAGLFLFPALGLILAWGCTPQAQDRPPPGGERAARPAPALRNGPKVVLVIHGGAGVLTEPEMKKEKLENGEPLKREHYEDALARALKAGYEALRQNKETAHVDAVEAAIRVMEDSELFNAGHGAALNHDGRAELDAAIMEGKMGEWTQGDPETEGKKDPRKRAGAVAAVWHIKNPISAARAVMEMPDQRHALLVGEGAESFVFSEETMKRYPGKLKRVSNAYFWTDRRLRDIRREIEGDEKKGRKGSSRLQGEGGRRNRYLGTVGAVARKGNKLAAGTSTGGLTHKLPGRVGDTPVLGAGTYADDRACGVSCTGTGEVFIRHAVAHDVVARMWYGKADVGQAAREAIEQLPDEKGGVGGLIALDKDGIAAFAMSKESEGMYRGYVTEEGDIYVAIYREEPRLVERVGKGGKDGRGEK